MYNNGSDYRLFRAISYGVKGTCMVDFKGRLPDVNKNIRKVIACPTRQRHCESQPSVP